MLYQILLTTALAATASAACSREFLTNASSAYVSAQSLGSSSSISSLAATTVNYTENDIPVSISKGILSQPLKIDRNLSIHDTTACSIFTQIIAASNTPPYVIGTRILFGNDSKINVMESLVTKPGDWLFNATGYLYWDNKEDWLPIPESKRDTRAVIQAAGDAYFNRFADTSVIVPFGTPCARLEGGGYTGARNLTGNSCDLGLPGNLTVQKRRYVVDEVMGVVDLFLGFPGLDATQGNKAAPDSHLFRVEAGKIRYIHTLSSCVVAGCGYNGTGIPS